MIIPPSIPRTVALVARTTIAPPINTSIASTASRTSSASPSATKSPSTPTGHHVHRYAVIIGVVTCLAVILLSHPTVAWSFFVCIKFLCNSIRIMCEGIAAIIMFLYHMPSTVWRSLVGRTNLCCRSRRQAPRTQTHQLPPQLSLPQLPPPIFFPSFGTPRAITPDPISSRSLTPESSPSPIPTPLPRRNNSGDSECPICYEEMNETRPPTIGAPCGHILCTPCRELVLEHARESHARPTCHICRLPYDESADVS